jgi:transposase-like protein
VQEQNPVTEPLIKKRRNTSAEIRQLHVNKWKQSGMTMSEYCQNHDVALTSLSAWSKAAKLPKQTFKPVVVTPSPVASIKQSGVIEILVDTRLKIRLIDIRSPLLVVDIVKELMRCSY